MANGYGYRGGNQGTSLETLQKRAEFDDLVSDRRQSERLARVADIEDKVFDISTQVVMAHLAFTEVDPQQEDPPEEWVQQFGEKAARRRLVVAKAGYLPASQMPSAVKLAMLVRTGIARNYSQQHGAKQMLNQVNVKIALPAPTSQEHPGEESYPVVDLDE